MYPKEFGTSHVCLVFEPRLSALPLHSTPLPAWLGHTLNMKNSQALPQSDSESFQWIKWASFSCFSPTGGWWAEGRGGSPVSKVFSWLWRGAALSCPSQPGSRSWCWRQSSGSGTFHTARNRGECPSAGWSLGSGRCGRSHILLQGRQHGY